LQEKDGIIHEGIVWRATAKPDLSTEIAERIKTDVMAADVSYTIADDLVKKLEEMGSTPPDAGSKSKGGRRK